MRRELQGEYVKAVVGGETVLSFLPQPLPPTPPLVVEESYDLSEKANRALGRLDSITTLLPDPYLFLYFYVRKEALLSSQIEGTQSSLSDLLLYESQGVPGVPINDVQEVSCYVAALNHGLERLRAGFPLCSRLIREIHGVLLREGRGSTQDPGEFRRSQNWVGGIRPGKALYVPPPQDKVQNCMTDLENFINDHPEPTPVLIKAALAHVQFETIHPFLDGNGRIGRLLITLILCAEGALSQPLLYLSLYFKQNRQEYYDLLQQVRLEGNWEAWLRFFLEGVMTTSEQATATARRIIGLFDQDSRRIESIGRAAGSTLRVHGFLRKHPLTTIGAVAEELALTTPTVTAALNHLQRLQIVRETTGRSRDRLYAYSDYLSILQEGTELSELESA